MGEVASSTTIRGSLDSGDCIARWSASHKWTDYIRFSLATPRTITLDLSSNDIDPYLVLFTWDGSRSTVLSRDDDGGPGNDARITQQLQAGTYYIATTKYDSPAGSYRLQIVLGPDQSSRRTVASCRSVGPVVNGIVFETTNVKLSERSSAAYRVTGIDQGGGRVLYRVCSDAQSISTDARDKLLFTAAMQRVFLESFVHQLPRPGSWWDPTGITGASRFKSWLSESDTFIGRRMNTYPSEKISIASLYVSLIDTTLVRLHSEVEDKLDRANYVIGTIYSLHGAYGVTQDIDRYSQLTRSGASIGQLGALRFSILGDLASAALGATAGAVRTAGEDLRLLNDRDRKDWMIEKVAEDVALVHSSAGQWIQLAQNVSARQPFTYEQAQDLAYHILLIRSLGRPSGQSLMDLKHSKPWWEFIGGRILDVIPFAGSVVSIGADAWDWIDNDDVRRPPTGYEPYNTWLTRVRQSAQGAVDQHEAFLARLGLDPRDDFRLPNVATTN